MIGKKILSCFILAALLFIPLTAQEKSSESKIPDYSQEARKIVPVEFTWNVEDIYPTLEEWTKDKEIVQKMIGTIEEKAQGWTTTPQKMLAFLELMGEVELKGTKLYSYVSLQGDMDLGDQQFQQLKGQLQMIFVQLQTKLSFINDDILKLGQEKFDEYLSQEPGLKPYAVGIKQILRMKEHILPKDQQKIVSMTGLFTGATERAAKMLNDVEIPAPEITLSDGKVIKLNFANYVRYRDSKNAADRALVMQTYWKNQKQFENTFAILFDAVMKEHLFSARIHNYGDCLEARLYSDDIDPKVYLNLVKSVRDNLEPLHRYLNLKKELLGLDKYRYEDIYVNAVSAVNKEFTWEEAEDIILKMMKPLGNEYVEGLKKAFDNRWIDRYSNMGKETGAYSSGIYSVHPYVKMNYNGTYDTLSTLAHELGHAMHSYLSDKNQHFANSDYATFLAEIASTFNENVLLDYLLKTQKDDMFKLYLLDSYLNQFRGTVYRQTLFADFELAMHRRVEEGKALTAEWLNKTYLETTRLYYGHDKGVVEVGDFIQSEWSGIPHFFYNYYVFTYSTGMIASQALTDMVLKDGKKMQQKYLDFLSAGGSRFPLDTLKLTGVDMTTQEPGQAAFKRFDNLVAEMEKIVKRLKKKGKLK